MDFPYESKYLLDWSPASGWSYLDFLLEKKFDPTLWFAVPEPVQKRLGSLEQLEKRGYVQSTKDKREGYAILIRSVSGVEQSVRLGATEIASALRWSFLLPSIGIERVNDSLKVLIDVVRNTSMTWAYEQFVQARNEYNHGLYASALEYVTQAIEGRGYRTGYTSEFRFYYLLGRIRLGGWFGDFKNAARDIIDPEKAEAAFLEAVRYRKHASTGLPDDVSSDTDIAQMLVWAARAAYIHGDTDGAVIHARNALGLLTSATRGLYPAAQFQYAKFLSTRGGDDDLAAAASALGEALSSDLLLILEAVVEPQFATRPEFLEAVLDAGQKEQQTKYAKIESDYDALLTKIDGFSYDDTAADTLLRDEVSGLRKSREAVGKEAAGGGLLDLDSASKMAGQAMPKPGFLFGLFKTRFNKDRLQRWENSKVTRAAKDAGTFLKYCEEELKQAEDVYRKNGGFSREGGADKFGYGLIFTLLSIYMFVAQARWGGAIVVAILFLVMALWLYLAFLRIKLGLVEGYEKYRSAKSTLFAAQTDATHKDEMSAKAWLAYQRVIDALGSINAPF
jgi:hypothetical protein